MFDSFATLFSGLEKVSDAVSMNVLVQESTKQKVLMLDFEDTNSGKTVKFCLFTQDEPSINATLSRDQSSSESKEKLEAPDNMPKDHYLVHTECLFLQKDHMILISVEKVQDEGLLVKMHDLLYLTSEEFYLVRKSNGHFTRLNAKLGEALEFKEDFRNLVVDLTFKAPVNEF